ncbi:MAG: Vitamin B12 transporter BtuB [Steroidobacteraceae bacterium]|nr:Vitamin B12 transporter BtuB [Steroidobacteraceae bacterium]
MPAPAARLPRFSSRSLRRALVVSIGLAPSIGLSQSATPGTQLEEVVVSAVRGPVGQRLDAAAGGTAIVDPADLPATANLTIARALASVPGVVVQDFFGGNDQPRIQIRGSGLQQNPVERGVLMLRNGLPLNRADGSYIVGLANPREMSAIEVYRGYMANRLGATVLGGAVNLISPTGRDAPGALLEAVGGSFDQAGGTAQFGYSAGRFDGFLHAGTTERDGYRAYNASRRDSVGGNIGVRIRDSLAVRFFASQVDLGFDVAGPITRELLGQHPRAVFAGPTVTPMGAINPGPNVVRDRPYREARQFQVGVRATNAFGAHILDLALGRTHTDDSFRFPVSAGIRVTGGDDTTAVLRYAFKPDAARTLPLFEATAQYVTGAADRENYLNLAGRRGALFGESRLDATTLSVNAGLHVPLGTSFTLSPSLSWSHATRDNDDRYDLPTRPTAAYNPASPGMALPPGAVPTVPNSYARKYEAWSPALGLAWQPDDRQTLFVAASRSFEPPTHDDLLATLNGTPNSSAGRPNPAAPSQPAAVFVTPALAAQRATTLEAGWRGAAGPVSIDAVVYHASIRNELLSLRDESGVALAAANASRTRHLGAELGLEVPLSATLDGRVVYTWQDFRFRNDPLRGNHRLAGAPRHWIHASLDWRPAARWSAQVAMRWMPERTPVDNFGTLWNDAWATVDLRVEHRMGRALSVFAEVTNLFDATYASSTLIVDRARPDQAAFLPGDGRALGAGVRLAF